MSLTATQRRDLRAISSDPGCYSKCRYDSELMELVNLGLIRWLTVGGYEITPAGRSSLEKQQEQP